MTTYVNVGEFPHIPTEIALVWMRLQLVDKEGVTQPVFTLVEFLASP